MFDFIPSLSTTTPLLNLKDHSVWYRAHYHLCLPFCVGVNRLDIQRKKALRSKLKFRNIFRNFKLSSVQNTHTQFGKDFVSKAEDRTKQPYNLESHALPIHLKLDEFECFEMNLVKILSTVQKTELNNPTIYSPTLYQPCKTGWIFEY